MRRSRRHRRHVCAARLSAFKAREAAQSATAKIAEASGLWALRGRLSPWVVNRKERHSYLQRQEWRYKYIKGY
ncbi:hypothetical protein [Alloprevotella tannerae]|uniref:hypothetical protein n=1 Tax=Alloprevotella tannerae TaxID=76122 RepID=UPI0028E87C1D|nr:hypothetical protein [Alloprevotella tannerae]